MKFTAAVVGMVLAGGMLVGCGNNTPPFDPCAVNPTYQAADGNWYEADGEPLDGDPCDSDDYDRHGKLKSGVKKPSVTSRPVPMVKQPAPKQTVGTNKGSNSTSTRKNTTGSGR